MQVQQGEQIVSCKEATGCICHWAGDGFSFVSFTQQEIERAWFESFWWS